MKIQKLLRLEELYGFFLIVMGVPPWNIEVMSSSTHSISALRISRMYLLRGSRWSSLVARHRLFLSVSQKMDGQQKSCAVGCATVDRLEDSRMWESYERTSAGSRAGSEYNWEIMRDSMYLDTVQPMFVEHKVCLHTMSILLSYIVARIYIYIVMICVTVWLYCVYSNLFI